MTTILPTLLEELYESLAQTKEGVHRVFQFPAAENMTKVAVGMRRTGKTYFIFQTIRNLLAQGVARERIFYIILKMIGFCRWIQKEWVN